MDLIATARDDAPAGRLPAARAQALAAEAGLAMPALMLALIELASERARPALSGYRVGAVGQGLSGDLYLGANFEMPAGPLSFTIHGEQAVVINALGGGERGLRRLAISAAPCGVCRQFLYELAGAERLELLLAERRVMRLTEVLPEAFGPGDLGVTGALMARAAPTLPELEDCADPLAQVAWAAAARSYVPYTDSAAGIALRLKDGAIHSGSAIENAAYNPALMPLQVALSAVAMAGGEPGSVVEAVLVEAAGAKLAFTEPSRMLLQSIAPDCAFSARAVTRSP